MPSFGENKNVMCYINPIYIYLRARSDGALGRERPSDHEPRSQTTGRRLSTIALSETGSERYHGVQIGYGHRNGLHGPI